MKIFKLCYVDLPWCYFTNKELSKQWGDDWNDTPYEHNAGTPYEPSRADLENRAVEFPDDWNKDGTPKWEIKKVAIDGICLDEPSEGHYNSPYSVEQINNGIVHWLRTPKYLSDNVKIMAGIELSEFIKIITDNGGEIFTPDEFLWRNKWNIGI